MLYHLAVGLYDFCEMFGPRGLVYLFVLGLRIGLRGPWWLGVREVGKGGLWDEWGGGYRGNQYGRAGVGKLRLCEYRNVWKLIEGDHIYRGAIRNARGRETRGIFFAW